MTSPSADLFRRAWFSGDGHLAPRRYGWIVDLGGPADKQELHWLRAHGYRFHGRRWYRADRGDYAAKAPPGVVIP